jgi:hypothetical protein
MCKKSAFILLVAFVLAACGKSETVATEQKPQATPQVEPAKADQTTKKSVSDLYESMGYTTFNVRKTLEANSIQFTENAENIKDYGTSTKFLTSSEAGGGSVVANSGMMGDGVVSMLKIRANYTDENAFNALIALLVQPQITEKGDNLIDDIAKKIKNVRQTGKDQFKEYENNGNLITANITPRMISVTIVKKKK